MGTGLYERAHSCPFKPPEWHLDHPEQDRHDREAGIHHAGLVRQHLHGREEHHHEGIRLGTVRGDAGDAPLP